ncbi:gonadotropin-releasing hormone receptor-like, partial [Penaeus japonicus]|uniref:gonadotropin-releasing hormone receptor-like n=1 Tax=Penaeus japonicus TaxID=27405 RepID=UPI001C70DC4D
AVVFHVSQGPFLEEFWQCVTYGFYTALWQEQLYTTFSLVCMFILPLFILTITYASTFVTLQKSERIFRNERTTLGNTCPEFNRRRLLRKAKMRALRISVVIVLAFIICWTPYYTTMVIFMFMDPTEHSPADAPSLHDYLWETEKAQDGDPPPAAAGDGETGQDRPVEKGQNSNQKASDCVIPSVCGSNKIYNIWPKASVTC